MSRVMLGTLASTTRRRLFSPAPPGRPSDRTTGEGRFDGVVRRTFGMLEGTRLGSGRSGGTMNISITFRHMDSSDAVRSYASGKIAKLQRFLRSPMTAKVTLSVDRKKHMVEVQISSGGEHIEAHETGDDMYASIDSVMDKLDRQIRGAKGAARAKRRSGQSLRTIRVAPGAAGARQGRASAPEKKKAKRAPAKRSR